MKTKKIIEDIKNTQLFKRHMLTSGVGYFSKPIMVFDTMIEVLVDNKHNYYKKELKKFVETHPELETAYFVKNGLNCTPYLVFVIKK